MNPQPNTHSLDLLVSQGILPLFYDADAALCKQLLQCLYDVGIRSVEFTNRGAEALSCFTALKKFSIQEMPDMELGIGTVMNTSQAESFLAAGADFVVSPMVEASIARLVQRQHRLWIPGCFTPTEVHQAQELGASLVKIFPASIAGPGYLSVLKELFPGLLFMPTGGIGPQAGVMQSWRDAGASVIGLGSQLIDFKRLRVGDFDSLRAQIGVLLKTEPVTPG